MTIWTFPLLAICGVLGAQFLRVRFSGEGLGCIKLYFCLAYNIIFGIIYVRIIQDDNYPFLGNRPDIAVEYPFLGWFFLICLLVHVFILPGKQKARWWFTKTTK